MVREIGQAKCAQQSYAYKISHPSWGPELLTLHHEHHDGIGPTVDSVRLVAITVTGSEGVCKWPLEAPIPQHLAADPIPNVKHNSNHPGNPI